MRSFYNGIRPFCIFRSKVFYAKDYICLSVCRIPLIIDIILGKKKVSVIIQFISERSILQSYTESMRRRLVAMGRNYVLFRQNDGVRDALFYMPSQPRRGLSSLVPLVPRLVIPPAYRREVIEMYHNYAFGGHYGVRRTAHKAQVIYYWPTL